LQARVVGRAPLYIALVNLTVILPFARELGGVDDGGVYAERYVFL
jgi:hypothetical protein